MNRDASHLARKQYASLDAILVDLIVTATQLGDVDPGSLLINASDLEFIQRRLVDLARGALDHVRVLSVIPHTAVHDPDRRHLRAVEDQ